MKDNTQAELRQRLAGIFYADKNGLNRYHLSRIDEGVEFITAYTNKQVEGVLDRLEYSNENWKYRETNDEEYKLGLNNGLRYSSESIKAERNKLKED